MEKCKSIINNSINMFLGWESLLSKKVELIQFQSWTLNIYLYKKLKIFIIKWSGTFMIYYWPGFWTWKFNWNPCLSGILASKAYLPRLERGLSDLLPKFIHFNLVGTIRVPLIIDN